MARTKISEFSATPGNNTDIDGINIAEGCAPSGINDAIRELMSQLKDFQAGTAGDSFNGPVGTTTAAAGAFTTLSASSTVSGTGFSTYLASPPAIGGTAAAAGSFTTLSASSTVTLSGGTANGVLYLNASKVATSGSALTFDGTSLSVGTTTGKGKLNSETLAATSPSTLASGAWDTTYSLFGQTGTNSGQSYGIGVDRNNQIVNLVALAPSSAWLDIRNWGLTHQFYISGSEQMRLTSTGLGIGTSSPASKLDVKGRVTLSGVGTSEVYTSDASGMYLTAATSGGMYVASDNNFIFRKASSPYTEYMRIDSSGNVGIGTSSPAAYAKLTVAGTAGAQTGASQQVVINAPTTTAGQGAGIRFNAASGAKEAVGVIGVVNEASGVSGAMTFHVYNAGADIPEYMRLDSSGNLGLGVPPSAWDFGGNLVLPGAGTYIAAKNINITFGANLAYTGGAEKYVASNPASKYYQGSGTHAWYTAASGTAGNAISFTQAMTLDASGNLGVGSTSISAVGSYRILDLNNTTGGYLSLSSGGTRVGALYGASTVVGLEAMGASAYLQFITNGTEHARITSGGYFKASDNGTYTGASGTYHEFYQSTNSGALLVNATNASYTDIALIVYAARNTTNNTFYAFSYYNTGAGNYKFRVADSGDVTNTNGTYGTISDAKMKTDIVDAGSQWSDIKALRFRKFKMKDDPSGLVQLGVVAQEVEQTSPGLVDEHADRDQEGNDLGTTTKSVKTSVLLMKAAVALQEAMARIEKLEAKVAALEGK